MVQKLRKHGLHETPSSKYGYSLLAGSTYDLGELYAGEQREYHDSQDYDGFLVKIDPTTGEIATKVSGTHNNDGNERMKLRVNAGFQMDDIIHGICLPPEDENSYVPSVNVVGYVKLQEGASSDDTIESDYGFVKKIDIRTMIVLWEDEIHGDNIQAIDCAVTEDGEILYVTGIAKDGGALHGWESNGGDDIWLRQYEASKGETRWESTGWVTGRRDFG